MELDTFNAREAALDLCKRLKDVEDARTGGSEDLPVSKVSELMRTAIKESLYIV